MERARPDARLEELEPDEGEEPAYESHLVMECQRLRRVPLRLLTVENLRILIGQNIGLRFLMPLAIQELQRNPLAEGSKPANTTVNRALKRAAALFHSKARS